MWFSGRSWPDDFSDRRGGSQTPSKSRSEPVDSRPDFSPPPSNSRSIVLRLDVSSSPCSRAGRIPLPLHLALRNYVGESSRAYSQTAALALSLCSRADCNEDNLELVSYTILVSIVTCPTNQTFMILLGSQH